MTLVSSDSDKMPSNNVLVVKCAVCEKVTEDDCDRPLSKIRLCASCSYSVRSTSSRFCLWCGSGNDLVLCIKCRMKCCKGCIRRHSGPESDDRIDLSSWCCFLCTSGSIKDRPHHSMPSISNDTRITFIPDRAETTVDICSPIVAVDDDRDTFNEENLTEKENDFTKQWEFDNEKPGANKGDPVEPCQDLDFLLGVYGRQIQASLELADANVPAIISEINSIRSDQLSSAIHSYRKCLNAFASDLGNLEDRVAQAEANTSSAPVTMGKLTSLLRILVQHHIFNRICRPQARMRDDLEAQSRQPFVPVKRVLEYGTKNSKPVVMVIDPSKRRNVVIRRQTTGGGEVDDVIARLQDLCARKRAQEDFEGHEAMKKARMAVDKGDRRALVAPGWMADFSIDKENEVPDCEARDIDYSDTWTVAGTRRLPGTGKRGRPPKYMVPADRHYYAGHEYGGRVQLAEDCMVPRGRGRPRKTVFINNKEPRYYVQKKNGEDLAMSL